MDGGCQEKEAPHISRVEGEKVVDINAVYGAEEEVVMNIVGIKLGVEGVVDIVNVSGAEEGGAVDTVTISRVEEEVVVDIVAIPRAVEEGYCRATPTGPVRGNPPLSPLTAAP